MYMKPILVDHGSTLGLILGSLHGGVDHDTLTGQQIIEPPFTTEIND